MTEELTVQLEQVAKTYGGGSRTVAALTDVSLHVSAAEFVSVMGPSGSGKSTLLNLVGGLDQASSGRVVVLGHELGGLSDDQRTDLRLHRIGFVFQGFNLLPTLTVEENVTWPLGFLGFGRSQARERAAAVLDEVGLPGAPRARWPAELSGGEQQMVAVARALVTSPTLLLADEPTGNLDSESARTILELLRRLNSEHRLAVVLVTHNNLAASYAHRVVELRDGRVVRDAGPALGSAEAS